MVKRIISIRWSCRADAVKALTSDYKEINEVLDQIAEDVDEKAVVRCEADGLFRQMK